MNTKYKKDNSSYISVVLPVHNGEKYIAAAIESIILQSYRNFEFIIIDDGSTDDTLSILKKYEVMDSRIRLLSRKRMGLVETLNEGIDLARGEWVARMDADDVALPQRFERQLQWLGQTGADICGSWVQLFGGHDKRILKHPESDVAIRMEMLFSTPFAHPTVMMKTELVKKLRYDVAWEKCEDYDLWERAVHAGWKMTNIQEVLLLYRQHPSQITSASIDTNTLFSIEIKRRYSKYLFKTLNLPNSCVDEILKLRYEYLGPVNIDLAQNIFHALLKNNVNEAREIIFDHVTKLYFRIAGNTSGVLPKWNALNKEFGNKGSIFIRLKLTLLSIFKISPSTPLFGLLKLVFQRN